MCVRSLLLLFFQVSGSISQQFQPLYSNPQANFQKSMGETLNPKPETEKYDSRDRTETEYVLFVSFWKWSKIIVIMFEFLGEVGIV